MDSVFLILVTVQGAGVSGSMTLMPLLAVQPSTQTGVLSSLRRKGNKHYNEVPCSDIKFPIVRSCSITLVYQLEHQLPLSIASQSSVATCKKKKNYKRCAYLNEGVESVMPGTSNHQ